MILHDPALGSSWTDYGILIPFPPERPARILGHLKLPAGKYYPPAPAPLTPPPYLELVHDRRYTGVLLGEEGEAAAERSVLETYELIDERGRPHRYDSSIAKKPLSRLIQDVTLRRLEGSYAAARFALQGTDGFCYYLSGGNHHARYDYGAGFCVLNDVVYAARRAQAEGLAKLVWIIDVDAHKGCGTAEIVDFIRTGRAAPFENGCEIVTLSVHMARGWPLDDETLAKAMPGRAPLIPSDAEIPVERGGEERYVAGLCEGLEKLVSVSGRNCDLAVVVDGSDPYEHDGLASTAALNLTLEQCLERDMAIFNFLRSRAIPSAWVLAGGYGERAWEPPAAFLSAIPHGEPVSLPG